MSSFVMQGLRFRRAARELNATSFWVLVLCIVLAGVDIATAEPGRWHLVPRLAEPILLWSPFVVALSSLLLAIAALHRGEQGARRREVWFVSAAITFFYVFSYVWLQFFPGRLY